MERTRWRQVRFGNHILVLTGALLGIALALGGCSSKPYAVGHPKRSLEPQGFAQAVSGQSWEAVAVRAGEGSSGVDYPSTRLLPVLLVVRNGGQGQPQVILEDVRGVAPDAEYMVYSPEEAMRLATARPFLKKAAQRASFGAIGAGIGAALGAGAGTLVYLLGGVKDPNLIWQATAAGGAVGGATGVLSGGSPVSRETADAVQADLGGNVWQEDPITPGTTRIGYLLLPGGLGITSVRIIVRGEAGSETHTLPIASAADYSPERAKAKASQAARPGQAAPQTPTAPIRQTEPALPQPKRVSPSMDI